jgi:hypothetical protein
MSELPTIDEVIDTLIDVVNQATQACDTKLVDDPTAPTGKRVVQSNYRCEHSFMGAYEDAFDVLVRLGKAHYIDGGEYAIRFDWMEASNE